MSNQSESGLRAGHSILLKIDGGTGYVVCLPDLRGNGMFVEPSSGVRRTSAPTDTPQRQRK